jgi:hypothetical protein
MARLDKTVTTFEKMGKNIGASVKAAKPERGRSVKRGNASGGFLEAATANHHANIQESLGAKLHPTAILYKQNAAEAGATQRNVTIVPSKAGLGDFYLKRQYGQKLQ